MDIHVYLSGRLLKKTRAPRERVVRSMRKGLKASLLREWVMQTPRQPNVYLKMRFVSPRVLSDAEAEHLAGALELGASHAAHRSSEARPTQHRDAQRNH